MLNLGDVFPNFTADTSDGEITLYDFLGDSWGLLFSHPADFTPVCSTEIGRASTLYPEFEKRNVKMLALSCDDVQSHKDWIKDIQFYCKEDFKFPFPIISDAKRELAVKFGMLDPEEKDAEGMPLTARAAFVIGPDKKMKLAILYPATTGRSFEEILRVIDSLQLTEAKPVATPADWKPGKSCMIIPTLSDEEAKKQFPDHEVHKVPSGKNYLRTTTLP
ncbi:UNVERIFIED_CONTAM: hypothetical protein RMT77_002056 [Armadillidium vulgare]|uniref:1-Cys peroxiredoxin n=1 Tax=Armadillidium nasatum TaxID=96803 RepID=A0A5N5SRT9_9CRUS|nr:Peroxiredoxin-6 [Armadillidium nasatum]